MEKLVTTVSVSLFLLTWCAVILVYVNVNEDVFISQDHPIAFDQNKEDKALITVIEDSTVEVAVQSEETSGQSVENYADQEFSDGVSIDELLDYLGIDEEAVPSS